MTKSAEKEAALAGLRREIAKTADGIRGVKDWLQAKDLGYETEYKIIVLMQQCEWLGKLEREYEQFGDRNFKRFQL